MSETLTDDLIHSKKVQWVTLLLLCLLYIMEIVILN